MSKVIARVFGGIGNQLFCYSAARRLAIKNDAELVIDSTSGFQSDKYSREYQLDHFNIPCRKATRLERLEPFSKYRRGLQRILNGNRPFDKRSYIQQQGREFDRRLLDVVVRGKLHLEGYWQSEQYFEDVEDQIRCDLTISAPEDEKNLQWAVRIRESQAVAIHVRFFDNPEGKSVNNVPNEYYSRALQELESRYPGSHYFVFSDRPEIAERLIPLPKNRFSCIHHNVGDAGAYADLWLMSQCRHFIIANSTFSWWGAWLSTYPEKVVVAPDFEVSGEGRVTSWSFSGLIPDTWLTL